MQFKKIAAITGSALMASLALAGPALATSVTALKDISKLVSITDSTVSYPMFVIGATAATSDVAGAVDAAVRLAAEAKTTSTIVAPGAAPTITGGVSLDTADTKLYLGDQLDKVKSILTLTELPELLASGIAEDASGVKYNYKEYLRLVQGSVYKIAYEQPDTAAGIKDPAYLIRLGTTPSASAYLYQSELIFDKAFNVTNAIGKELKLFGSTYTISADSDMSTSKLIMFGTAAKTTIGAGESATITIAEKSYTAKVIGIIDATKAVVEINGVTKEVTEKNTYDFAGLSVYIDEVFYYKVPIETGSVVISAGANRIVFTNATAVKVGPSGSEQDVKGTYVLMTKDGSNRLTSLKVATDSYTASPRVDYIKEGLAFTDPVYKTIKVLFGGVVTPTTETLTVLPVSSISYGLQFTDKSGKAGSVEWDYYNTTATAYKLADSAGNDMIMVENATLGLNQYTVINAGGFPHLIRVTSIDSTNNITEFQDVISGTSYKFTATGGTNTGTLVIDGQDYTVLIASASAVNIKDSVTGTNVYPTLETKYGAKFALTQLNNVPVASGANTIVLPTATVVVTVNGTTNYNITQDSTTVVSNTVLGTASNGNVGRVPYWFNVSTAGTSMDIRLNSTTYPAALIIEEKTFGATNPDAAIYWAEYDTGSDKRLELTTSPVYTHATADIAKEVSTSSDKVFNTVTKWGTKVVRDVTAAGLATITYPDTQVTFTAAVGPDPKIVGGAAGGQVTTEKVLPITADVVKLDSEISSADKSTYDLVLVGGPCVNTLVAELATAGKFPYTCANWPGRNFGRVQLISDAFATGKTALVIAGTRAADTDLAARIVQTGFPGASDTVKAGASTEVTGSVSSPAYS